MSNKSSDSGSSASSSPSSKEPSSKRTKTGDDDEQEHESTAVLPTLPNEEGEQTAVPDFKKMKKEKIEKYLQEMFESGKKDALQAATEELDKIADENKGNGQLGYEFMKLALLASEKFNNILETEVNMLKTKKEAPTSPAQKQESVLKLGTEIPFLGYGSSAGNGKNEEHVNEILKSHDETERNNKGAMLSHPFYRSFLRRVCTYSEQEESASTELSEFQSAYELIQKKPQVGILKASSGSCQSLETNTTALISAFFNQLIPTFVNKNSGDNTTKQKIAWVSEYVLKFSEKNASNKTVTKKPRTDGMLVAADPLSDNALRPLVSMEAKIGSFNQKNNVQSRSNAVDAISLKPSGDDPWPLLVFRLSYENCGISVYVYAVVPTDEKKGINVLLWNHSTGGSSGIFIAFKAAIEASLDFLKILQQEKKQIPFSKVVGYVALDYQKKKVYKSFYNAGDHRRINFHLIKKFIDPKAKVVSLGKFGFYLKMNYLGPVLPLEFMCNCQLFLEIAADLRKLHKEGYCHGDIRVSNLILGGSVGKIIDFDFAGKAEKDTYPPNLQTLVDGDRHEDVKNAIKKGDIGDLPLQFDHDWYSLKQAMHCFEAKESVNQGAWQNLIDQIDEEEVSTPSFFTVVLKKEKQNIPSKTGTPPKNQPTSTGGDAT